MTFNGGDDGDSQFISSTRESVMMRKERDCVDGFRTPRYCVRSSTTSDRPVGCGSSACTFTAPLNTQQHRPQFITCNTPSEHTATQTTVHHLYHSLWTQSNTDHSSIPIPHPLNTQQHRPQFITCTTPSEHTATQTTVHHLYHALWTHSNTDHSSSSVPRPLNTATQTTVHHP